MSAFKFKKIIGAIFIGLFIFSYLPKEAEGAHLFISSLTITLSGGNAQFNGQFNNGSPGNILAPDHSPFVAHVRKNSELSTIDGTMSVDNFGNFSVSVNLTSQGEGTYAYSFYDQGAHKYIGPNPYSHFDSYQPGVGQPPIITLPVLGPETPPVSSITTLETDPATDRTVSSATLHGHFVSTKFPTTVWFKYGDAPNHFDAQTGGEDKSANDNFSRAVTQYGVLNLLPNTTYYYKSCAKNIDGERCADNDVETFATQNYVDLASNQPPGSLVPYTLLAPLPEAGTCTTDSTGAQVCTVDTTEKYAFAKYLNAMIKIFIGICAVLAMIMIVVGGIEYMTSELISSKEAGKERILNAIFGLLLALGSYALLNTIDPALLDVSLSGLPQATVGVYPISGTVTFDGQPIQVKFNTEAYPAAKAASQSTGVNVAFILAVFAQETGSGANVGRCHWHDAAANMYPADQTALQTITSELALNIDNVPVSCSLSTGHGGAIGYTQFRPATWLEQRQEAQGYLGHMPNPWNTADALMVEAVYLKHLGALTNEKESACKYYGGPANSCSTNAGIDNYGNQVMGKKLSIQQQIDDLISKGIIT